jgi:hypothetical protein
MHRYIGPAARTTLDMHDIQCYVIHLIAALDAAIVGPSQDQDLRDLRDRILRLIPTSNSGGSVTCINVLQRQIHPACSYRWYYITCKCISAAADNETNLDLRKDPTSDLGHGQISAVNTDLRTVQA